MPLRPSQPVISTGLASRMASNLAGWPWGCEARIVFGNYRRCWSKGRWPEVRPESDNRPRTNRSRFSYECTGSEGDRLGIDQR